MSDYIAYTRSLLDSTPLKGVLAFAGALLLDIFGANAEAYQILGYLIVLDTATGFMAAAKRGVVSSKGFLAKTSRKLFIFFALVVATYQFSRLVPNAGVLEAFGTGIDINSFIVIFLASNELLSVVENCHVLGVPIPGPLVKFLEKYHK